MKIAYVNAEWIEENEPHSLEQYRRTGIQTTKWSPFNCYRSSDYAVEWAPSVMHALVCPVQLRQSYNNIAHNFKENITN